MKIYIKKSPASSFELLETSDKELGKGGQASVYKITTSGYENYCIKIYKDNSSAKNNYSRIVYMIENPPQAFNQSGNNFRICWPTALAYDMQKNFIGYIMPLAFQNSRNLKILEVYNAKPISQQPKYKNYPDWFDKYELDSAVGLKNRIKMLCNWAIAMHSLHMTNKYVIIDIKPENVMATSSGKISIVDTDSFQILENGKILFPGPAYTPGYFPPEGKIIHQNKGAFPTYCDYFAAAICFYKILTGVHPYGGTIKKSPYDKLENDEEFINAGLFAYGDKKNYLEFNKSFNLHKNFDNLSPAIQKLFIRAFGSDPNARPNLEEWGKAFYESAISNSNTLRSIVKPPVTNSLPIQIKNVRFGDTDKEFNIIKNYGSQLDSKTQYLTPEITYQVNKPGADVEIWYKIFSPSGKLLNGNNSKSGYTAKGQLKCSSKTTFTEAISGFGNSNMTCYSDEGIWKIEFYIGDKCLYKTNLEIRKAGSSTTSSSSTSTTFKPSTTPTSSYGGYYTRKSAWQRFDDFITDIGDWFAKNIDDAPDIVAFILAGIYVIGALAVIIYTWINDGFGWAILAFVISVALGYVGLIAIGIVNLICKFIMGTLRVYFYSGASFLVVNIIIFGCLGLFMADKNFSSKVKAKTEISAPATIEYICTANEFINIRVSPNTKANVLGRVKRGESVQVYEIKNGFAKVKWGSGYGYANANYIKKKN